MINFTFRLYNLPTDAFSYGVNHLILRKSFSLMFRSIQFPFLFFIFSVYLTHSTSLNPLSLKQLYQHADLIVIAQITDVQQIKQNTRVYSKYSLQIEEYLKGSGSSILQIQQLGGRTQNYKTIVSAIRQYKIDQRIILFLNNHPSNGWDTLGYAQGSILLQGSSLLFDHYHFFIDPSSISKINLNSPEYKLLQQLQQFKMVSHLKELFKHYES